MTAVRSSMFHLIDHVRGLIADPASTTQVFADLEIQDELDRTRLYIRTMPLMPSPSIEPTGTGSGQVVHKEFFASLGVWENDAILQQGTDWTTVTPASADLIRGVWTFATDMTVALYVTGKLYDAYGAAASLLEMWAGRFKLQYDALSDDQEFMRSQKQKQLLMQAQAYRRRSRPLTVRQNRSDLA